MEQISTQCKKSPRISTRFHETLCKFFDFYAICKILRDFIKTPYFKSTFAWGVALYLIALFALLRGDIYYMDDFQHTISNYSNANTFSRFIMPLLLGGVLTFGKSTLDISPLPQIFGVILIVLSSMILLYLIRKKLDFIGILASLPLGLSPHFLQNLSYKFDALTMSFALFLAILPFLFHTQKRIFSTISVVCLILMLMTYQAANATYIILSLFFAFFMSGNFKQFVGFLGICVLNLVIASLLYGIFIMQPVSEYIVAYTSDKMLPPNTLLIGISQNLTTYFTTLFNDFKNTPFIYLIALNCVLFVINTTCGKFLGNTSSLQESASHSFTSRKNRRIYAFLNAIFFLALGFILSYGLYVVLEMPIFEPRVFYGFNALMAVICIANIAVSNAESRLDSANHIESNEKSTKISCSTQKYKPILPFLPILRVFSHISIIITAYFLISFANIYGNALKKQDEFLDFRANLLMKELGDKIPQDAMIVIDISEMGNANVTQRFYEKYGNWRIIPILSTRGDFWFAMKLRHLRASYNFSDVEICEMLKAEFGSEIIAENTYHKIEKAKICYIISVR